MGHGEVILVVEDEPLLLKLTTTLCQKLGYQAVGASLARGALDFILSGKDVDLLFTDVVLPGGMDGIQLALEARAVRPELPVLLTTGYAEQSVWRLTRDLSNYDLITKPFDTDTLARKLRGVLSK
jgi:CheY-like chemotaxis protein